MSTSDETDIPVLVEVRVQLYGLSRHAVIHRSPCDCDRRQAYPKPWQTYRVRDLSDLAAVVWPMDWKIPLRGLAHRFSLGHCEPRLPIPPAIRTLIGQEPPVPQIETLVVEDAIGKHIVHAPDCDCIGGIRARKTGTGTAYLVQSVAELAPLVFPAAVGGGRASVEELVACAFEVKKCIDIPLTTPAPPPYETKLATAVLRAYSTLVALATTASTVDAERTRDAHNRLEQRVEAARAQRQRPPGLLPQDVTAHLAAASEAALWTTVRGDANGEAGDGSTDRAKAEAWVKAAHRMRARLRWDVEQSGRPALEPMARAVHGADPMERAFAHGEQTGRVRFLRNVGDALNQVDAILREGDAEQRRRLGM